MLPTALQSKDPVIIFEYASQMNMEAELPEDAGAVDLRKAKVRKEGKDLTILTYGLGVFKCLEAAASLMEAGINVEVIDLRILRPLDDATIMASVAKTNRVLIVEDAWKTLSLSAELSSRITEQAFYDLDAPVHRLCGVEVPIPYPKHLEEASVPQVADIVQLAKKILRHD
jgi:pyruvate dehydrogenase E1 component beta subunit